MLGRKRASGIACILIVEDEPLVAFDNEQFLQSGGYDVAATLDRVADARARIDEGGIDLILADVSLADGSGVDVARHAKAAGIPLLFVTGECPAEARDLAIGCLAKPYPLRDLLASIRIVEAILSGQKPKRIPKGLSLYADSVSAASTVS